MYGILKVFIFNVSLKTIPVVIRSCPLFQDCTGSPLEQHYTAGSDQETELTSGDEGLRYMRPNGMDARDPNRQLRSHVIDATRDPASIQERQWILAKEAVEVRDTYQINIA